MALKLMIPGPIELENEVLDVMGAPNHVHYGDVWLTIHNETIALLQQVMGTTGRIFIMPGSGSLGLDAGIHSTFSPGDKVVAGMNGFFGRRLNELLTANGVTVVPVEGPPDQPLDPAAFERVLSDDPSITGVMVVHLETSTAILNPVKEIAQVARQHDCLMVVDAVSSLAGTTLQMDDWGIDLCLSASQKGLGAAAGISIIAVSPRAWDRIEKQSEHVRSWYLDLRRWQWYVENWGDWHPFPVTMPTAVIRGLHVALQSLIRDGFDERMKRYETLAKRLRDGLQELGMALVVPESQMSPVLTAVYCPEGVSSGDVVNYVETEHHIKITAGFGESKDRIIRIGHMGGAIGATNIDNLLAALRQYLEANQ